MGRGRVGRSLALLSLSPFNLREYMKKLTLSICLFASIVAADGVHAQTIVKSLERNVPGEGKVTVHQDPHIEALMVTDRTINEDQKVIKSSGFRIQAYAGNNTRQAKNEAHQVAARIKDRFPELPIYTSFNPPRWICRAGDFRSIEEADAMMRRMKSTGMFKEVSIVRDQINIPL